MILFILAVCDVLKKIPDNFEYFVALELLFFDAPLYGLAWAALMVTG